MNPRSTPSLRIARLIVENFRTFREPTEISLSSESGADAIPVFHGLNGSGKSNALAAIDLFFRVASYWLSSIASPAIQNAAPDLQRRWDMWDDYTGLFLSHRSWPPGIRNPQSIEMHFSDPELGLLRVVLAPSGNGVYLRLERSSELEAGSNVKHEFVPVNDKDYAMWLANTLETPIGPGSKPFFLLDARRRDFRAMGSGTVPQGASPATLSAPMAERLLAMATSLEPDETERWRSFVSLVGRFKTLSGREVSVVRAGNGADLRFEIRGKQILQLSELSSGEQQAIALNAAVLTSRAAIVAIEEPEISLHPDNQKLVHEMLSEHVASGIVDQIILESHVPVFDGPEVIRFNRTPEGTTTVSRQPSSSALETQLRERAQQRGATEQWVTPEGYTQLQEEMRRDLHLEQGGNLWFLQGGSEGRWQAWKADELDRMFGFGEDDSKDK